MNYYPFHLGDYAAHTAHLDILEDLAYRRLLDLYYLREAPIPADVQEAARLIRMKAQAEYVEAVLREFFELSEDGWRHRRCDEEIGRMKQKRAANDEKTTHERERMRRHRERRSELFEELRVAGITPAWDVSITELQRLRNACRNQPETHLQREQVETCNAPATAIPIPTPIPTPIPIPINTPSLRSGVDRTVTVKRPDDVPEDVWRDFLAVRKAKRSPLTPKAFEGIEREAKKAGLSIAEALNICIERGWQGFQASWDWKRTATRGPAPENFAAKDYGKGGDL